MERTTYAIVLLLAMSIAVSEASANLRFRRGALNDDAERILRQGSNVDVNNVGQLIDLVERNRAEECLARVICELSHSTKSYGDAGSKFAQSLLKFRNSTHPKAKYYQDAMAEGAKSKNAEICRSHFRKCNHPMIEVVNVGNKLLRTK